jgi:uncharacterized membrane protein
MPVGRGGIASGRSTVAAGVILVGIGPLVIYRVMAGAAPAWLIGVVIVAQVTTIAWLLSSKLAVPCRAGLIVATLAVIAAVVLVFGVPTRSVGLAVGGICHAAAYSGLLIWFAGSLRRDREPVVTGLARQMRRTMPVTVVRYTRLVTIAWCIFFGAQLGMSAALLAVAPQAVWWSFVNLLNVPLIMAMILAEFGCRLLLIRQEHRTGLIATLAGLRHIRGLPGSRS